jgi:predicted deacylase
MFPGYDKGETTQRIAAAVLEATRAAPYRVDLHSSNLDFEELPHVRLFDPSPAEREKSHWFGLPAMVEARIEKILTVSLMRAWKLQGGENFMLRGGQAGNIRLAHCELMYGALLNFLHRTRILAGEQLTEQDEDQHYFAVGEKFKIISEEAGFFVSKLSVGQWIKAGDLVGYLYDGFTGKVRAEIRAPVGGLVLGLRRQPLVCEGDLIARLQCRT